MIWRFQVTGGVAPYSYEWSNGSSSPTLNVCPQTTSLYTVTITDDAGCTFELETMVHVVDIRCKTGKVWVCKKKKNGNFVTRCVKVKKVPEILAAGGSLGACDQSDPCAITRNRVIEGYGNAFTVSPNPSHGNFDVIVIDGEASEISIYNTQGKIIFNSLTSENNYYLNLEKEPAGLYLVRVKFRDGTAQTQKVIIN